MEPTILNAFLVMGGILAALIVLGLIICVIHDVYKYRVLHGKLKKDRERKQIQREEKDNELNNL